MVKPTDLANLFWASALESEDLKQVVLKLDYSAQRLIYLRFWECMTIEEISKEVRMTWDETDKAIDRALLDLRKNLLRENTRDGAA